MAAKWYPVLIPDEVIVGDGYEFKTICELKVTDMLLRLAAINANFSEASFESRLLTDEQVKEMRNGTSK